MYASTNKTVHSTNLNESHGSRITKVVVFAAIHNNQRSRRTCFRIHPVVRCYHTLVQGPWQTCRLNVFAYLITFQKYVPNSNLKRENKQKYHSFSWQGGNNHDFLVTTKSSWSGGVKVIKNIKINKEWCTLRLKQTPPWVDANNWIDLLP